MPTTEIPDNRPSAADEHGENLCEQEITILELAHAELRKSSYRSLRQLSCVLHDSVLTLHGHVPSYYMKQIAQSVLHHRLEGLVIINNQLEVE